MHLPDDPQKAGMSFLLLHWSMAALIFSLFFLGKYMVDLDYYHPMYHKAPDLHRSLGVIVAILLVIRLGYRLSNPHLTVVAKKWEQRVAIWVHRIFYLLIGVVVISGYLISTADGQGIEIFNWFEIPAVFYGLENQEDIAGEMHAVLTQTLFLLALFHALAALKHHFIDHDLTLHRMLGQCEKRSFSSSKNVTKE